MTETLPDSDRIRPGPGKTLDFERGIPFLVSALGNRLADIASRDVRKDLGIGLMEWRIVALLAVESRATPARVGQVSGVDKSVVSRAAATLEQRGLIEVEADAHGSRQTRLSLTDTGHELHDRGVQVAFERCDALLEGFSEDERELLTDFLKRAMANLRGLEAAQER
jgi:DNA-binding MarR family transcriptional regulator